MSMVPVNAIDPDKTTRDWHHQHEWHLALVPTILEQLVWMTIPHVTAKPIDKPRITGGGYIDNIRIIDTGRGPAADARHLWATIVEYTRAVTEWTNHTLPVPAAPALPPIDWNHAPLNPDPLTAKSTALVTVGWLIDHADMTIHQLDDYRDTMYQLIRRHRAAYNITPRSRRPRTTCRLCLARAVTVVWADNPNGSPKPIRIARCRNCGHEYTEEHTT